MVAMFKSESRSSYQLRQLLGPKPVKRMTVTTGLFAGERGEVRQQNDTTVWLELDDGTVHQFPRSWTR